MLPSGFAFWRNDHVWFVLTDPIPQKGRVVCVNLTTFDDDCIDDECILYKTDYAWIKNDHPTVVAFSYAQNYNVEKLEQAYNEGLIKAPSPALIPPATLRKVRSIAKIARELSNELKQLL